MNLLGRTKECAALGRIKAGVVDGASQVLVLRGDPGAGKSVLLHYLRDQLEGWRVLSTSGVESETGLAYSGLHQLCAPLLEQHLDRLPLPQREALATALGLAPGSPPDQFLVGLATLSLVADAAEQQPVVCLIDDGQWLDHASNQVLSFVARRLLAEPVALVCATRIDQEEEILAGFPELQLRGLSDPDARKLLLSNVHGPLDSAVVDQIVTESHGNPLALLELPRTWQASDLAGGFGLPDSPTTAHKIERSYVRRLTVLPAETQLLALAAAAEPLGDPVLLSRAAGLLGTDLTVADPAVDVGLLEVGERVSFAHPLARSAAYHHGSTEHRHQVHHALATATNAETDPDRRAWHLARATVGSDEEVAAELERSADRARARGGIAAAAAFLTRAMELTPELVDRSRRALDAAFANVQAGSFDTARRMLAIANRGPIEEGQRARSELLGAQLALVATRGNDAAGPLLTAARRLETLNIDLARETYMDAFTASLFGARLNELVDVRDVAAAARAAPRSQADDPSAVDLLLDAFTALTGDYEQAVPVCRAGVRRLQVDRRSPDAELRWFWHGAVLALELWDDESAYHLSEHHTRMARTTGALSQLALALSSHTPVLVFRGDLSAGDFAVAEAESVQEVTGIQAAPYGALLVKAWRGLEHETKDLVDTTVREATSRGEGIGVAVSEYAHAVLCNSLGQYEEALMAALHATEDSRELVAHNWSLSELVEAAVRSDRADLAAQAHHRLARKARASATSWALGLEARARALLNDGDGAEDPYRQALAHLDRTSVRSELARTHLLYGEWLRRANRRVDARTELTTAYESFNAMRMGAFAERARGELLATGATVRKRKIAAEDTMTPQEAHIARLARDGMSNIEIGAQLFLSARTVEWHLRKVFRKLNIGSRHQLRSVLAE
ncbi:MAG: LuxR family transcriptional regulator fused with ATPase domain [Marmoricola sp.]|nr:LuxR family transcriptional regulator fused with ATPase domain [Marmoricola sp.]